MDAAESVLNAPYAGGVISIRLVLVDEPEKVQALTQTSPHNEFMKDAQYILVVCTDGKITEAMYGKDAKRYTQQQAGAAIENVLLKVTDLGLGACWVGAFNENAVKRVLLIPDNVHIEALIPIGYELKKSEKKRKYSLKSILSYNKFGKKIW